MGFPGASDGKESACNAGDPGLIPRWGRCLEKGIATHYTKGTFHAKMGSVKDRNGMDQPEAEDIKKRWQEYTEELYKKDLNDLDNHDSAVT